MTSGSARILSFVVSVLLVAPLRAAADPPASPAALPGVGPQYDTSHVYVAQGDVDRFVASFTATFGGTSTSPNVMTITPVPSKAIVRAALSPAGLVSVFGFETPVPYPFGAERTGYLVSDIDAAVASARANGAAVVVATFDDPIGRDAIVEWPGGVFMQFYWHTTAPHYAPLATVPENRAYVSADAVDAFVKGFVSFSGGKVVSDDARAPGVEIGRPGDAYRRIRIESTFGKMTVLVTDGHLPYPFGRETTGYEVSDLAATLAKAQASGATVLVAPFDAQDRREAIVQFPGGYVAEIHAGR